MAPVKHREPDVERKDWVRNPIDAFVLHQLEEKRIAPAPSASKRVLARRLYFDLVGLPPTPDEMNAFLADNSPDAYAKVPTYYCSADSNFVTACEKYLLSSRLRSLVWALN